MKPESVLHSVNKLLKMCFETVLSHQIFKK